MAPAAEGGLAERMEAILHEVALNVALVAELICVVCIAVGAIEATILGAKVIFGGPEVHVSRREVWVRFARWIILALEFALGADIARTAIAPTWDDIGQLAAIAVIRTALNYFLERDLESMKAAQEEARIESR